jgi:hypothetical protein
MSPAEFSRALGELLDTERAAIRRLDAVAVLQSSEEKERLLALLATMPAEARAPYVTALSDHRAALRRNLVLLAHTRDCIRDALNASGKISGPRALVSTEL